MNAYDVAIIGAGVVGCALARELAPNHSVLVLERLEAVGLETSRFNSGVIHSGIHLPRTFQKGMLAANGSLLIRKYCLTKGVPLRQVGMHVVVAGKDVPGLIGQMGNLWRMLRNAHALGINVSIVDPLTVRRREPNVRCVFGLWMPNVHIIDQRAFVQSLYDDAVGRGADFHFSTPVNSLAADGEAWIVGSVTAESFRARLVINAAGLYASEIAALAGLRHEQYFFRGEYFEVVRPDLRVNSLVYPVYKPRVPGLGIHLTPTVDGRLLVGPNAKQVSCNRDYGVRPTPPKEFHAAVAPFFPNLRVDDLRRGPIGIRPKLSPERSENDFRIVFEDRRPRMVNLIGIESPGLTASLALAEYIASEIQTRSFLD